MERRLPEFDVSRRKAEARGIMGRTFPEGFASISRMQNSALSRTGKSLLLASVKVSLDVPIVARRMRRLSNPRGGPESQDVLTAMDWDMNSDEEDTSFEACAAFRKAKRRENRPGGRVKTPKEQTESEWAGRC